MPFDQAMKQELEGILASMGTDAFDSDSNPRLEVLLGESDEARRIYLEHCQMHAMLHQSTLLAAFHAKKPQSVHVRSRRMRGSFARWTGLAVVASAVFIIGLASAKFFRDDPGKVNSAPESGIAYVETLEGSAWLDESELVQGANVSIGTIRVVVGTISLRFDNGTTLLVEGLTELSIDNDMQVTLKHGKVAARVSEDAHGFTVLGPDSAVVDLGTEFAMVVKDGESWVEVYDGEVDVALLNEDGHAWKSRQLTASGPVRIDAPNGRIIDEAPAVAMPRFSGFSLDGLEVPVAYVDAVLKGKPVHYWRFEESTDSQVADIAGDAIATLKGGARIHNHGLYLPPGLTDRPREKRNHGCVSVSEPSSSLANDEFTIEAWVKPAFPQKRRLLDIRHRDPQSPAKTILYSLCLISSEQQTIYPRETFQFTASMWPHGEKGEVSAFSAARYRPDSWQHVVAVRHEDRMVLYLDGKSARAMPVPPITSSSLPATISIGDGERFPGQLRNRGFFKGMVDEVALYPSAMSAERVAEHYQLMQPH